MNELEYEGTIRRLEEQIKEQEEIIEELQEDNDELKAQFEQEKIWLKELEDENALLRTALRKSDERCHWLEENYT